MNHASSPEAEHQTSAGSDGREGMPPAASPKREGSAEPGTAPEPKAEAGTVRPGDAAPGLAAPTPARLREDLIHPDPLLDCLIEVCRLQGTSATRASLSAGLPLSDGRLALDQLERAASRVGMVTRLRRLALRAIDAASLPAILLQRDNKACVLLSIDANRGTASVLLPETGQGSVTMSLEALESGYIGVAAFVRPHFRFDSRTLAGAAASSGHPHKQAGAAGHWFWGAILSQRGVYRDVLVAALLINVFALAMPMFTMNVYDRVVPNQVMETLWALSAGVALMIGADYLMRVLRSHYVDEASARIDVQLSSSIMERVLGMRLEHRPESVGSFAANLRSYEQVRDFIASSTVTTLVDLPFAALFLVVIAWISPWLILPVVGGAAAVLGVAYVLQKRLHSLSENSSRAAAQRNATLVEAVSGIETVKSQGAEAAIQRKWEENHAYLASVNIQMRALSANGTYFTMTVTQAVSVLLVIVGVYLMKGQALTMGALIACNMLASRALAPIGQVVALLMQYQGARTSLENLERIMNQPQERPAGQSFVHRAQLKGEIEFRGVSFSYPGRKEKVLDKVSFKLAAGDRVALIGRMGSGKSTIQRLIMGLYQPTEGAVLLDGIDMRQLDPADVRHNQGYVSQDVMLFHGSLRSNIALGLPYADDAAIVDAANVACIGDFVNRHPSGFDMPVGERGEMLSGGQRQCVGIARAVLHNAPIMLLDEPTSAMDFSSEAKVTAAMTSFVDGKTVVLVTHRTSMLSMVNRVIVVDGGRIVADGPRDRVLQALSAGRVAEAA